MKTIISLALCGTILGFATPAISGESDNSGLTLGAEVGTTGLGGSVSLRFTDHIGVRGGVNYFSYDTEEFTYASKPDGVTASDQKFDVTLRLLSAPVAVDLYPWADSAFRVSLGVLVNQNRFKATVKNSGVVNSTFAFNGNDYLQSAVGDFDLEVEQQTLSPYLSIGTSIYLDSKRHWALSGELGVAYTGSPKVSLSAPNHDPALDITPNFSDDVSAEESKIEKDAEDYKFYPIIKIGVSYTF